MQTRCLYSFNYQHFQGNQNYSTKMIYQLTNIEFDLDPGDDSIPEHIQEQVHQELRDEYIGTNWAADDEDDLIEEITNASGWCIKSIDYVVV
jgi:hypothetical protein